MEAKRRIKDRFEPHCVCLELMREHFHGYAFKIPCERKIYFRVFALLLN
jgi:hypothetical protein